MDPIRWIRTCLSRLSPGAVALFLLIWLMVGFSLGTSTLMGPVRWATALSRRSGMGQTVENLLVQALIVLLVVGSAGVAFWLIRAVRRTSRRHVRYGLPLLAGAAAAGALWLWLTPSVMGSDVSEETHVGAHFTFGSFPVEERLRQLEREGYTAVVPLLHPAVVPFEPKLLADLHRAATRVGIEVIHIPILPWISENEDALQALEDLARNGTGRYFVHCYLGKDRVQVARRVVERTGRAAAVSTEVQARSLLEMGSFERGKIYPLSEDVYLTPYPTEEEFLAFFLAGSLRQVVSLLDPEDPDDLGWIEKERVLLEPHGLSFTNLPVSLRSYDPLEVLAVARQVRTLPRPLVVHAFLSPSTGRSPAAEAFLQAFRSDLPPLPPSLFARTLEGGATAVTAPNVATGPRPTGREFGAVLFRSGLREILYLGHPTDPAAREDAPVARGAGLGWHILPPGSDRIVDRLSRGGPWYLYGSGVADVRREVAARLGPPIPPEMIRKRHSIPDREKDKDTPVRAGVDGMSRPGGAPSSGLFAFLARACPDARQVVLLGPVLLLLSALAAALSGWLRQVRGVRTPFTRKVFHFLIFTIAGLVHLGGGFPAVALFGGMVSLMVLYAVLRGDGFAFYEAMARPSDRPRRTLFIVVPLVTTALGGLGSNLFFAPYAFVGYLVGGWGDAVGEPVGAAWGHHRYRVPSLGGVAATRSLEGSAAVALAGCAAAFLGLWAFGIPLLAAAGVAVACGLAGAAVEAFSHHGLDNLTIQVAAAGMVYFLLG